MPNCYDDTRERLARRKQLMEKAKAKIKLKFPHLEIGSRQYENVLAIYMK